MDLRSIHLCCWLCSWRCVHEQTCLQGRSCSLITFTSAWKQRARQEQDTGLRLDVEVDVDEQVWLKMFGCDAGRKRFSLAFLFYPYTHAHSHRRTLSGDVLSLVQVSSEFDLHECEDVYFPFCSLPPFVFPAFGVLPLLSQRDARVCFHNGSQHNHTTFHDFSCLTT